MFFVQYIRSRHCNCKFCLPVWCIFLRNDWTFPEEWFINEKLNCSSHITFIYRVFFSHNIKVNLTFKPLHSSLLCFPLTLFSLKGTFCWHRTTINPWNRNKGKRNGAGLAWESQSHCFADQYFKLTNTLLVQTHTHMPFPPPV